jgi:D-alanine-D-alanine ligase
MRVAVLGGGRSSEHEVSLKSAAAVAAGVGAAGHEVLEITLHQDGTWACGGEALVLAPGRGLLEADVVFPALHGPFGEDGTVQGLLELLDVPYVGAGVLASALSMDKVLFKDLLAAAGVPQVAYAAVDRQEFLDDFEAVSARLRPLGWPLFVKPARAGSSVGIGKVGGPGELRDALDAAFAHDVVAIVEAASTGREVECSVLGLDRLEISVAGEIALRDADWYDYEAKYTPGAMELVVPARVSETAAEAIRRLAADTFLRVGCSGLARVDFFIEGDKVLVNELNTMPGFTQTSVYPKLWAASGLPFPELCDRLLGYAVERHRRQRAAHA